MVIHLSAPVTAHSQDNRQYWGGAGRRSRPPSPSAARLSTGALPAVGPAAASPRPTEVPTAVHDLGVTSSPPLVPRRVTEAFGLIGTPVALAGGEGTSVQIGRAVLKPVDDPVEAAWSADAVGPTEGGWLPPGAAASGFGRILGRGRVGGDGPGQGP